MTSVGNDVEIAKGITVTKYRQLEDAQNRDAIADVIHQRFTERYILPLNNTPENKNGFCTTAICCLMIEALESFWQGWPDTKARGKGRSAFRLFFDRHSTLNVFQPHAVDFYENVRCGILHQAETKKGWRIRRVGQLFDPKTKTLNATKLHRALDVCLEEYRVALKLAGWDTLIWTNLRKKMDAVCANCIP